MSASGNGEYRRPGSDRQVMVAEKVLQSRLSRSLPPVCPFPGTVCIRRSLQGESDKHTGLTPVRILEIAAENVIGQVHCMVCAYIQTHT